MEQNSQQSENIIERQSCPLSVAFLGFEKLDEESFTRFFQVVRPYQRQYVAANRAEQFSGDILLVNYDNPSALKEKDAIVSKKPSMPVVAVSRGPLPEAPLYHIRGFLFASRVLTTLDKVHIDSAHKGSSAETQKIIDPPRLFGQALSKLPLFKTAIQIQKTPGVVAVPAPILVAEPVLKTATNIVGYSALVVDDSIAIQKSLEINLSTLTQIGRIDLADSGEAALEKAEAWHYDLIFLDVMMPGIDGYETCTRLRNKPEYKKTPIIMVSGKTSPLDEVKGVMAGCTTYLTKPVQKEAFQKLSVRVLAWLESRNKH